MGIDARMLVIVTGPSPSAQQIKLWSANLCVALGAEHFFQNREKGEQALALSKGYDYSSGEENPAKLGKMYNQDGPDLIAEENETFLEVSLWSRYYGPGYERGNWQLICSVAEWCEVNIPNCRVLYGGDSSGACLEPFGMAERWKLKQHAYGKHSRDYFTDRGRFASAVPAPKPDLSDCKLCVKEYSPQQFGYGPQYASYHCAVCGEYFTTKDNGKTWAHGEKESRL